MPHTPSPWRIEQPTPGLKFPLIQGANWSGEVAVVYGDSGEEEAQANARLIAATPDLLAALEALTSAFMAHTQWNGEPPVEIIAARIAIAKATSNI